MQVLVASVMVVSRPFLPFVIFLAVGMTVLMPVRRRGSDISRLRCQRRYMSGLC